MIKQYLLGSFTLYNSHKNLDERGNFICIPERIVKKYFKRMPNSRNGYWKFDGSGDNIKDFIKDLYELTK